MIRFGSGAAIARKGETNWSCITTPVRDRKTGAPALIASAHALVGVSGGNGAEIWLPDGTRDDPVVIGYVGKIARGTVGDAVLIRPNAMAVKRIGRQKAALVTHTGLPVANQRLALAGRDGRSSVGWVTRLGLFSVRHGATAITFEGFRLEPVRGLSGYRLCAPGDSGGMWYDTDTRAAIGVHVAGGRCAQSGRPYALACRLDRIMNAFGVEIPA